MRAEYVLEIRIVCLARADGRPSMPSYNGQAFELSHATSRNGHPTAESDWQRPGKPGAGRPLARHRHAAAPTYADGHHIEPHWHARAQFVFAVAGTMRVRTPRRAWIVPPSRALWVPARTVHEIQMYGVVEMRSLYLDDGAGGGHAVLVRRAERHAAAARADRARGGAARALRRGGRRRPADAAARRGDPAPAAVRARPAAAGEPGSERAVRAHTRRSLRAAAVRQRCEPTCDTSTRTLYRRFLRETGITFARWKQQARLLESIRRLAEGAPVTTVARGSRLRQPERVFHHVPALAGDSAEGVPELVG